MLNGNDYLLFVKEGAAWKVVACLRSNGVDMSTAEITSETKCNSGFEESLPGTKSWSFPFEGDAIDDAAEPSQVSHDYLFDQWTAGNTFPAKVAQVEGTYVRYGNVYLTGLTESQDVNAPFTFTGTLKGTGPLSKTEPVAP